MEPSVPAAKNKALQRIVRCMLRYAQTAVWALLALGILAFLLLPLAAKKCFLDEKALLVGGAVPTVRQLGAVDACLAAYQQLEANPPVGGWTSLVYAAAAAVPAAPPPLHFHRYNFSGSSSSSSGDGRHQQCSSLHTVVRSRRGDGTEGLALLMPLDSSSSSGGGSGDWSAAAFAAAAGASLAAHLQRSAWLAKDVALVFCDAACGVELCSQEWLAAYHSPHALFAFPRAGALQQALVLQLVAAASSASAAAAASSAGVAELSVHGVAGQLPNLDMYYQVKRNLDLHAPLLPARLRASTAPLPAAVQRGTAALAAAATSLGLTSAAAAQHYASELQTLAAFSLQLASGRPTGGHAAFLQQQIDAVSLTIHLPAAASAAGSAGQGQGPGSSSGGVGSRARHAQFSQLQVVAHSSLAAVELALRTLNNLQERLHHSTALYVLLSPDRFVSIAGYLAPPGLLLGAGLIQLILKSRAAAGASLADWHAAWRRVAAAHALGWLAAAVATQIPGSPSVVEPAAASIQQQQQEEQQRGWVWQLIQRLVWAAAAGVVVAEGPAALLATVSPPGASTGNDAGAGEGAGNANGAGDGAGHGDGDGDVSRSSSVLQACRSQRVHQCVSAAGLAMAVLQGAHLLLGQWVRCWAFLLAVVPMYASAAGSSGGSRLASLAGVASAGALAAWVCRHSGSWLLSLLAPHLLLGLYALV